MRAPAVAALLALCLAAPASAQNGREKFVTPDTALDAVHAEQQRAFVVLRDSISSISAAGARLMSEMTSSSSLAWMRPRAQAVASACARSAVPLANAKTVTAGAVWPEEGQRKAQANLLKAMPGFANELAACQKTLDHARGGHQPGRASRIGAAPDEAPAGQGGRVQPDRRHLPQVYHRQASSAASAQVLTSIPVTASSPRPSGIVDTHFHMGWIITLRGATPSVYRSTFHPHKIA